jgi:hypothetical protein
MKKPLFSIIYLLCFAAIFFTEDILEFDVHFAVITKNPKARRAASIAQFQKEIEILNRYFVSDKGEKLIQFKYKSSSSYEEIKNSACSFIALGDTTFDYDSNSWAELFNECNDISIKDPHAINFFVYDSWSKEEGFGDMTSHGKRNFNKPYVLIDWERLDHNIQSPEEHEMGHAFGLDHVFEKGAKINSDTNIMASSEGDDTSGGKRNIGFNEEQVKMIREYAKKIQKRLND